MTFKLHLVALSSHSNVPVHGLRRKTPGAGGTKLRTKEALDRYAELHVMVRTVCVCDCDKRTLLTTVNGSTESWK